MLFILVVLQLFSHSQKLSISLGKKKGEFYLAQKIKRLPSCSSTSCERNLHFMVIDDFQAQFKCLNQIAVGLAVNHLFHVLEMISKTSLNPFFMKTSTRAHTV